MRFRPLERSEMEARHRAVSIARPRREAVVRNVTPVLSLGDLEFITFRGAPFGVPPVPLKAGHRLRMICLESARHRTITLANADAYHAQIAQLPDLLWSLCRPCGPARRVLRWLGLMRNPFHLANDQELVELATFFLTRLMTSSIGFPPRQAPIATS